MLTTGRGRFAVKHARFKVSVEDAEADAAYQEVVCLAGVPMPAVVRTIKGAVTAPTDSGFVRVDEWVDVLPAGRRLDPDQVGRLLAAIHAVGVPTLLPAAVEAEGLLTSPRQVQLCHRDLWADNVRRTPGGGLVVLDWENSGPGDVNGELGCALAEDGVEEPDRERASNADWVAEYLDEPVTRETVDRVLLAVNG